MTSYTPTNTAALRRALEPEQYLAMRFTEHLQLEGITPSVGSVGDAYDNALMESIIGLHETDCVRPGPFHTGPFKTLSEVEFATMAWVDWYNHRRLHATLGMITLPSARQPTMPHSNRSRSPSEDGTRPRKVHYGGCERSAGGVLVAARCSPATTVGWDNLPMERWRSPMWRRWAVNAELSRSLCSCGWCCGVT
jgi:putative transposase